MTEPHHLGHAETISLLATLSLVAGGRRPLYADLLALTGLGRNRLLLALRRLRAAGLVDFEPGRKGTLHPVVVAVPLASTR